MKTGLDSKGNPTFGTPLTFSVQGIRDNFRFEFATANGIPTTDVRILLIMGLIVPATVPVADDLIFIDGGWYKVRKVVEIDPANAHIQMAAFSTPAPT